MTDPLMRSLNAMDWPAPAMDCPVPQRGQLWRAAWDDVAALVVIAGSADVRTIPVVIATADQVGDESTVAVTTENNMQVAVWTGLHAEIMMFTLDHRIGDLTASSLAAVTAAEAGTHLSEWAPITSDLDDRTLVRLALEERLQAFADADWVPDIAEDSVSLAQLADDAGVPASEIAAHLNVAPGAARRLLQGRAELTEDQRGALTELIGPVPESNLRIDDDLAAAIDSPENRPRLQLIAIRDHDGDEVAARIDGAQRVMGMAARQSSKGERNWAELTRLALDED